MLTKKPGSSVLPTGEHSLYSRCRGLWARLPPGGYSALVLSNIWESRMQGTPYRTLGGPLAYLAVPVCFSLAGP